MMTLLELQTQVRIEIARLDRGWIQTGHNDVERLRASNLTCALFPNTDGRLFNVRGLRESGITKDVIEALIFYGYGQEGYSL